jgi:hypothetical protein
MQKLGEKTMNIDEPADHEYPKRMMHLVRHHYNEGSKSFNSEKIMYCLDSLESEALNCATQASHREYITARNLFDN